MAERSSNSLITRRPLLMFFVLSYAFFWTFLLLSAVTIFGLLRLPMSAVPSWTMLLLTIIGSWMPSLAAALVTGIGEGPDAVRRLFAKFFLFRLPARWYLAALMPLGLAFAAAGDVPLAGRGGSRRRQPDAGLLGRSFRVELLQRRNR